MKQSFKIALISIVLALAVTILSTINEDREVFFFALGIIHLVFGIVSLVIAVILALAKNEVWSKAFLVSAGILVLIGTGICGPMLLSV